MNQIGREIDYVARMQGIIMSKRRSQRLKNVALEPYNTPPEGNVPLNELQGVDGPGTSGTTVTLLSFTVPDGWDGLLNNLFTAYTGTNLIPASGDLVWALRIDQLYIKGYQAITVAYGSLAAGRLSDGLAITPGIPIRSGQLVEIIVTVDSLFTPDGASKIFAGLSGFFYPNGIARTN